METFLAMYLAGSLLALGISRAFDEHHKHPWTAVFSFVLSWFTVGSIIGFVLREQMMKNADR